MPAYQRISGETFYIRGSPASIVYRAGETLYIVDPGHGSGKLKSVSKTVRDLGGGRVVAVITHYHSDHLELVARRPELFEETVASILDRPGVEDPLVRVTMTFGYPLPPESDLLPFRAPPVRVDTAIEPGQEIGPLRTVPLPGHTPGQIGVLTPDGVLYAADAVFGSRVLERYPLPYHLDPCVALESVRAIARLDWDILAPGHGPVLGREEALEMLRANEEAIESMISRILEAIEEPRSAEEITRILVGGRSQGPGMYMLLEQTVRGALTCLYKQGRARPVLSPQGLAWERA